MKQALLDLETIELKKIEESNSLSSLDDLRVAVLGKKGALTDILKSLSGLSKEEKPVIGQLANQVKTRLFKAINEKKESLEKVALDAKLTQDPIDNTLPGEFTPIGKKHIITQTIEHISNIFAQCGFSTKTGPDIESDYYNFEALNIPQDHPARDMHDTFYIPGNHVLRTHTSPVQIRTMEAEKPPLKIICPGKVYRYDSDTSHSPVFHQIEGLYVDEGVSFADLKGTLAFFLKNCFGDDVDIRFRSSYFPFTEPSVEVDIRLNDKNSPLAGKWLEIGGAGMVQRKVFKHVNYDESITGFAFGLGVERIAMLRHHIPDIRLFYENDCRFLKQF